MRLKSLRGAKSYGLVRIVALLLKRNSTAEPAVQASGGADPIIQMYIFHEIGPGMNSSCTKSFVFVKCPPLGLRFKVQL
jgi:hypothetical protein